MLIVMLVALVVAVCPSVGVSSVTCGQTITQDTTLSEDLACPPGSGTALLIGASDVTLDLGGHRLSGHYVIPPSENLARGIVVVGDVERVVIRNGMIEGFNEAIGIFGGPRDVTVRDINIRNLTIADSDHFVIGVNIADSRDVLIEDSRFHFAPVVHKDAVAFFRSNVRVERIEVNGGAIGVSVGGGPSDCGPPNAPTTGEVLDSTFLNQQSVGIFVQCTSHIRIAGNTFASPDLQGEDIAGGSIGSHAPYPGAVSGIIMEHNLVEGLVFGIKFQGIVNSVVAENRVMDSSAYGIQMDRSLKCDHLATNLPPLPPGYECFYSTGNIIRDNEVLGSGIVDLLHHPLATGNTWQHNTCLTTEGAEIRPCNCPDLICGGSYRGWRLELLRQKD